MSQSLPIERDTRRRDLAATVGQTVFTFPLPLLDAADLRVRAKVAPATVFSTLTTGFTVTLAGDKASASVAFDAAPRPSISDPLVTIRLEGARVPVRTADVTRAGAIRSVPLEAELDATAIVLQEVRRDVDGAGSDVFDAADVATAMRDEAVAAAEAAQTWNPANYYQKSETDALYVPLSQIGTGAGEIPVLPSAGTLPALSGAALTNVDAVTLGGKVIGSGADQIVKVGTDGKLPAIDGSQLTGMRSRRLITTLTLTGLTQWDVTGLADYSEIELEFEGVDIGTAAATILARTSADNGASFASSGYSSDVMFWNTSAQSHVAITNGLLVHYQNFASDPYHGSVRVVNLKDVVKTGVEWGTQSLTGRKNHSAGRYNTARAENALRLVASTAPSAGICRVWGRT